jgi:leucyl/phenylalanyl-tRNA--protein transferase
LIVASLFDRPHPRLPHPLEQEEPAISPLFYTEQLSPEFILYAYTFGFFPWGVHTHGVDWWFTMPRFVLKPQQVHLGKNVRRLIKTGIFHCSMNCAFDKVIRACADVRRKDGQPTWLEESQINVFEVLHAKGWAHSIETWDNSGQLIGGLYGLSIGNIFYGESMFHYTSGASKVAFAHLCHFLMDNQFELIDCQMETPLLASFGAQNISGQTFFEYLRRNWYSEAQRTCWKQMPQF